MGAILPIMPLYTISLGPLYHKILCPPLEVVAKCPTSSKICSERLSPTFVSKLSLYKKSFVCFQRKWALQIYIFIEPKFRPPRHILTLEVAGETLQRSLQTLLAAGSYIQPYLYGNLILAEI